VRSSTFPGNVCGAKSKLLRTLSQKYPALRSIVLAHEQALLCHTQQSATCNAVHNLRSRLARHLLRAADLHCQDEFPLTQDHLAEILGVRRTTVTLIANRFQKAGMINYRRGQIKVCDRAKLENAACECYRAIKSNYQTMFPNPTLPTLTEVGS